MDLIEENKDFIKGKLYRVKDTKHPMFCRYNSNEVISCRANAFIFLGKNKLNNRGYLFYAISECAIVDIDGGWTIASLKEIK